MRARIAPRSVVLALSAILAGATIVLADTVSGDADLLTAGAQPSRYLGEVAPGAVLHVPIDFRLACRGTSHVDPGQVILLAVSSVTVPAGGAADASDGAVGPIPQSWADDTHGSTGCPSPAPTPLTASILGQATLVAPRAPGGPYTYSFLFDRTLVPLGTNDFSALTSSTAVSFSLTVVANTPPVLTVPADATHEGNATGGWLGAWSASATDAEDNPDPAPACDPVSGTLLRLGTTEIDCAVVDSGGMWARGSFRVTVQDTRPPVYTDVPTSVDAVTSSAGGMAVQYPMPSADDVVDASPSVACAPGSGSTFAVGTTTVRCTATDRSGNVARAAFPVTVTWLRAAFGPPIGADGSVTIRSARTLPVKIAVFRDGVAERIGPVTLRLTDLGACPAAPSKRDARGRLPGRTVMAAGALPLRFDAGADRWSVEVVLAAWDMTPGGCYRVDALDRGMVAGGFDIAVMP